MRVAGVSGMYGVSNVSAAQRYQSLRNAARSNVVKPSQYSANRTYSTRSVSGVNSAYGVNAAYGVNRTNGANRVYGSSAAQGTGSAAADVYEGTKAAAQSLRTHGQNLMDTGKDSLMRVAEEQGSVKEYAAEVANFVDSYNTMVKNMASTGGTMNELYAKELQNHVKSHQEDLAAIGITAGKDGSLKIDTEALGKAELSALTKAFGSSESFGGKTAVKSIYVEANAASQQTTAQYARFGNLSTAGAYGIYGNNAYGGYGSYGIYGNNSTYGRAASALGSYASYGNYSALGNYLGLGLGGYGSGYGTGSLAGALFNSLF